MSLNFLLAFLFLGITKDANSLEMGPRDFPRSKYVGDNAEFVCNFELNETETLFSVNWYKNGDEFYRFVPTEDPTVSTFPVRGISHEGMVNEESSTRVKLGNLTFDSAGNYLCQVTANTTTTNEYGESSETIGGMGRLMIRAAPVTEAPNTDSTSLSGNFQNMVPNSVLVLTILTILIFRPMETLD